MIKNFYEYGGRLHPHTPSYVKRFADGQLYELLKQNYFCYVFNCRQMGKSSLQTQVKMRLEATNTQENQCVYLSIQEMGVSQSISENQWYRELSKKIFGELNLDKQADFKECWSRFSGQGAVSSFSDFMAEVLLALTSSNLVIFIDEIDKILELSFRDNFFGLIRAFHEKRAEYDDFNRLTFCFLGVTTPNDLIQNPLQSPFNIGRAIELRGFEFNESLVLAQGLQDVASVPEEVLREILFWTGGQPFLTQKICALLVESQVRIGEGQEKSFIEEFIYSSIIRNWEAQDDPLHLKYIKTRLLAKELLTGKLLEIYRHILQNGYFTTEGNQLESELRLSGLVVKRNADLEIFNPIYREVFSLEWVQKQLDNLRPYAVALNTWLASGKNNPYLLDETEIARADIWREGKFLTREDEEFIRDSKLAQKDKDSAQKIEAEREAKKILEKAKKKAQKALIGSIIASALIVAGTLIFAVIQTNKAERASQEANQSMQDLTNIKKERDKIGQEVIRANDRLSQVSAERRQIELNARQRLAVAQGNLKRLETARNQAQQQVTQFQRQKTILEGERQIILAQKLEAESRTRKSQEELNRIEKNLQTNLRQLDRVDKSLRAAEQARQVAIKETQLEQRGISLARRFEKGGEGQISLLLEAMKAGQELQAMTKAGLTDEYSTPSFLYALHTIIDGIRELNSISVKSPVFKTMLSSDGKCIAISAWDGVFLWHLDKNLLIEFKVNEESTTEILFSPDNKYVLTASENYNARLWDLQGNLLVEFKGHSDFVTSLAFSSNGKYLATGSRDGTAYIWDLQGNLITKFKAYDKSSIESIAFNPDGNYLMTGLDDSSRNDSDDNIHRIWDLKGNLIGEFKSHARAVFSPNGKYLATGSSDGNIRLWDLQGNLIAKFQKSKDFIESLIFSPDGKYLITRSELGFPRLWDLQGNMIKELKRDNQWDKQYTSSGDILGFDRDGKYLITDLGNSSFGFWDLQGNLIKEFKIHTDDGVTTIAFSPDEKYFVTGSSGGFTVSFWTTLQDNSLTKFKVDSGVNSIAFSSNSQYITTGNSNEIVHLWNLQGNLIREFKTIASDNIVKFSSDGKYLAAASDTLSDPLFYLWDLQGNLIRKSKESELHIMGSMNFSPDGKFLGIGFRNGTARIWNLQSNFTREFFVDKSYVDVASVAFSSDNKYFINGTENGYIYIWNVQGSFIRKFKVSSGSYPSSLALSPDGKLLATGLGMYANSPSNDSIILWDLQGKLIAKFKGYRPSVVYSIEFSPDGKYLATGSSDNTARLWDLKGNILAEFKGHQGDVSSVAFSPDGQYLATGSSDKTARLWRIEGLDELLVRGCHWLKDYFVSHPRDLQELPVCQQALKTSR